MSTIILACQTIKDEVELAIKETGVDFPVFLIESGLHNYPNLLHKRIQEELNRVLNVKNILMAFGLCGNSLMGISSPNARIIVPRVDDCISLILGSLEMRHKICKETGTYFITKGWLDNEQNILTEFERMVERFGHDRALKVIKSLLRHYHRFMLVDTGAYPLDDVRRKTREMADLFGLKYEETVGTSRYLKKLLAGPWDEEFVILEPGEVMTFERMNLRSYGCEEGCCQLFCSNA